MVKNRRGFVKGSIYSVFLFTKWGAGFFCFSSGIDGVLQKFVDILIYSSSRVWKDIRIFLKFLYECLSLLYKKRSKQEHVFSKRIWLVENLLRKDREGGKGNISYRSSEDIKGHKKVWMLSHARLSILSNVVRIIQLLLLQNQLLLSQLLLL